MFYEKRKKKKKVWDHICWLNNFDQGKFSLITFGWPV